MSTIDSYFHCVADVLPRIPAEPVERIVGILRDAQANGRCIFMFANGGSSANASHLVNDFVKSVRVAGRPRMRALCLSDNTPLLTAVANDLSYDVVFEHMLSVQKVRRHILLLGPCRSVATSRPRLVSMATGIGVSAVSPCSASRSSSSR